MNDSQSRSSILNIAILDSPPIPGRAFEVKARSNSITIGWSESSCDGGHPIVSFDIRYDRQYGYFSARTILHIDPTRRNYTITGLQSNTFYTFQVRSRSVNSRTSSYSSSVFITTLAPGMLYLHIGRRVLAQCLHIKWTFKFFFTVASYTIYDINT